MYKAMEKKQIETLKEAARNKYGKRYTSIYSVDVDEKNAFICESGYTVHIIPKDLFFLDIETLIHNENLKKITGDLTENADIPLKTTGYQTEIDKNRVLIEYTDADGRFFYFNKKLLETFGKVADLYLTGKDPKSPAAIRDANGHLYGIICPVRHIRPA